MEHHTADCVSADPHVRFPPDQHDDKWKDMCLWCGVKGHDLKECWKRAPATAAANTTAIAGVQEEMKGIKQSVANVDKLQTTVDSLGVQTSTLIQWQ